MRWYRALAAGVAWIVFHPGAGPGFELPTPATLLGTGDPLEVLPDSLPGVIAFRSRTELRELYRYRHGAEFQDYDLWTLHTVALARTGPVWTGVSFTRNGLAFDRREVYEEQDVLRARREVDHFAFLAAARSRLGEIRALVGGASGPEIGLRFHAAEAWPGTLSLGWWWTRGRTDVSQKVRDTTFFFPFRYQEQVFHLELERQLSRQWRGRLWSSFGSVSGEEPYPGQYNRLDVDQDRVGVALAGSDRFPLELMCSRDAFRVGLEMTLDHTWYARARALEITHWSGEAGWRLPRDLRVAAGYERWTVDSTDPSYVDVWPFTVWDVFTATRYRLESLDFRLGTPYVRAGWSPRLDPFSFALQLTWEWWDGRGNLFWKKRVPTFPPFFFRYDHYQDSLDPRPTNGAQADVGVRWDGLSGLFVQLDAQLVAPLGDREEAGDAVGGGTSPPLPGPGPGPGDSEPESVRGGLRGVLTLGADW